MVFELKIDIKKNVRVIDLLLWSRLESLGILIMVIIKDTNLSYEFVISMLPTKQSHIKLINSLGDANGSTKQTYREGGHGASKEQNGSNSNCKSKGKYWNHAKHEHMRKDLRLRKTNQGNSKNNIQT